MKFSPDFILNVCLHSQHRDQTGSMSVSDIYSCHMSKCAYLQVSVIQLKPFYWNFFHSCISHIVLLWKALVPLGFSMFASQPIHAAEQMVSGKQEHSHRNTQQVLFVFLKDVTSHASLSAFIKCKLPSHRPAAHSSNRWGKKHEK